MTSRLGFLVAASRSLTLLGCIAAAGCSQLGLSRGDAPATEAMTRDHFDPTRESGGGAPFYGIVVADEPTAALAGREILRQGGTAADAAAAGLLVMGVTLPTTAGLGGGGVCMTWHSDRHVADVIDFRPRRTAGGGMSVPMTVRGLAFLQARDGRLRWEQVVSPAERLATLGTPVSRALTIDLAEAAGQGRLEGAARGLVGDAAGQPLKLGTTLVQPALARFLARVRGEGGADLYTGPGAAILAQAVRAAGGDLTADDLRAAVPSVATPQQIPVGDLAVWLPAPGDGGGPVADLLDRLVKGRYGDLAPAERPALIAAASRAAFDAEAKRRGTATVPDAAAPPAASLIAADGSGTVIACGVTQLGWFGSGRLVPDFGIFLAPPAPAGGLVEPVPVLAGSRSGARLYLAAVAGGGRGAPVSGAITALGTLVEGLPLSVVLERPRYYGTDQGVVAEDPDSDSGQALVQGGAALTRSGPIARVLGLICPTGIPADKVSCAAAVDPRMAGLAAGY